MGAVQKLATVVIVGLVALATLLVVYLAAEPDRRAAEAEEKEHAGTDDEPVVLDEHRGMMAQKATEVRRHLAAFEAEQAALRKRQTELERHLLAAPAATWEDAAEKARYLLALFAATSEGRDPRRQRVIAGVLDDFRRLSAARSTPPVGVEEEPDLPGG